tara:strand:+ start:423 stop:647 length:225 start_codon:yes stop_codon:yes gene_type:complete
MEKIILDYLKRKYSKKVSKINKETIILNNGLTLDSLEFLDFIIYIEKKTKKKFLSSNSNDLINLKVKDLSKLFK